MFKRMKISLNHDWQFERSRESKRWLLSEPSGTNVDLPHCWNDTDGFQDDVAYYRGWGSYRRSFFIDAADLDPDCQWRLVSEGFYGTGDVWLNGHHLGKVDGQYLGFSFDVTDLLRAGGDNRIGIRLTNHCGRSVLPGIDMPDFLLYGGLSGRLWLERIPLSCIRAETLQVRTWLGWTPSFGSQVAEVRIAYDLDGVHGSGWDLTWRVFDAEGHEVASNACRSVSPGRSEIPVRLESPRRWDVSDPYLYSVEGKLCFKGEEIDKVSVRFGVCFAEFRPNEGFFLNGRRVALRGCNRHENMPGFGRALPVWMHREDARLIKSMGLNFVRLSHYPQHPEFLDACDELGILVYAELASWKSVRGGRWLKNACRQMSDMILRDRNHPSVILWGMGNEGRHAGAYQRLYHLCKSLDPTRAVTYAENHLYRARRTRTLGIPDVWGTNYEFDAIEEGRDACRLRTVVVSECSNYPHAIRGEEIEEKRQLDIVRHDIGLLEGKSFVAGYALWCFNDYATLRKQRYKRYSGIVDAWRIPKSSAYWLSERYGGMLGVQPAVVSGGEGELSVVLHPERLSLDAGERETVGIGVEIINRDGQRCDWCGDVIASVSGSGRLRSYNAEGKVHIAKGIGRVFVTAGGSAGMIQLTVSGVGVRESSMDISVEVKER